MKRTTAMILAGALIAGTATVASADYGRGQHRWGCDRGDRIERMHKELGLTDQQVTKLRAIRDKYRPQKEKLRDEMRANRDKMRALMDTGNASESSVRKLADAEGRLMSNMIVLHSDMKQEMDKVLTKEQLQKRNELREKWREERKERRGERDYR